MGPCQWLLPAYDVRKQCYRSVFAGACGVTYGHHAVWQFYSPREEKINFADRYWTDAIDRPGAYQVGYLRKLIERYAAWDRIPDTTMIEEGQGKKGDYIAAFITADLSKAMVYLPVNRYIVVNTNKLSGDSLTLTVFDPRRGTYENKGRVANTGKLIFTPPIGGADWVLILSAHTGDRPVYRQSSFR